MEIVVQNIKVKNNTLFTNPIFFRSCYQHSFPVYQRICLFRPLFHKLQLLQIPAFTNSSFLRQLLFQAAKNSGFFKFWLPQAASFNSGCEKFWLLQFLKNSSFSRFQLRKIPAFPNSGFLRRPLLEQVAKNSGFEKFCL